MKSLLIAAAVLAIYPVHATSQSNNLSRAYVSAVASAKGSTEFVEGRSSTVRDHGGAWMRITTDEIGYGRNAQARLLGSPLRELGSLPLCNVGGQPTPCNGRGTVIGYRRTWDASGREGGNFEYMVIPKRHWRTGAGRLSGSVKEKAGRSLARPLVYFLRQWISG